MPDSEELGEILVVATDDWQEHWQPVPANGFASVHLSPARVRMDHPLGLGTQTVPPGCYVREHTHAGNEEVIHVLAGGGTARLDGVPHPLRTGVTIFIGKGRRHTFINDGDTDLTFLWVMVPNGLEEFFERIGRPKASEEPAPKPFARPADVDEIERTTVFGPPIPDAFKD